MSDEIYKKLDDWGISHEKLTEDEGAKASANFEAILTALEDPKLNVGDRLAVVNAVTTFQALTDDGIRLSPMIKGLPKLTEIIKSVMLSPDDDDKVEKGYYSSQGLQTIAENLASMFYGFSATSAEFGKAAWEPALKILDAVADAKFKEASALRSEGSQISRLNAAESLLNTKPPWGSDDNPPAMFADVMIKYLDKSKPSSLIRTAGSTLSSVATTSPQVLQGKYGVVFAGIDAGVEEMKQILISSYQAAYKSDPEIFHQNIDIIMKKLDFIQAGAVLHLIADKNGKVLAPYVIQFTEMLEKGVQYNMETMVLTVLNGIAKSAPDSVLEHLDRIYAAGIKIPNGDVTLAMIISNCGSSTKKGSSEKVLIMLCEMLKHGQLGSHSPAVILNGIVNQFSSLPGQTSLLDPYMETIKKFEGSAGQTVEKIKDWHAGRSLEDVSTRLEELEAKVAALNEDFAKQCKNWQDVEKMMDSKIADLKEFVGEIVKKLPQPIKLTVVGGVKKTLVLHFKCAKTGGEVTTETKEWSQWCKVGFGLIKLGKCAVVAASTGNVGALGAGVSAIKDIYGAYKSKDDKDFNTFIKQPFLTSAESDRLIEQLRDSGFFEKMGYDAQLGDWVLISEMDETTKAKYDKKKQEQEATTSKVSKKKGKNMGLGSVGDIAQAAITSSDLVGASVGGKSAGEIADSVGKAKENAQMVGSIIKGGGKGGKGGKKEKELPSTSTNANTQIVVRNPQQSRPGFFSRLFGKGGKNTVSAEIYENRISELERRVQALEEKIGQTS